MIRRPPSFRRRILLWLAGLVVCAQVATTVAVLYATHRSVVEHTRDSLGIGGRVFDRLMQARGQQLLDSVQVLSADFGFRQAVATNDTPTVRSALANHGARISAGVVLLLSLDGRIRADTRVENGAGRLFPFPQVLAAAERDGSATATVVLDGEPFQMVMAPVQTPLRVAWVCMGFPIADSLAAELKSLTGLEVSFWVSDGNRGRLLASTLPEDERDEVAAAIRDSGEAMSVPRLMAGTDYLAIERRLSEHRGAVVSAVLQSSVAVAQEAFSGLRTQLVLLAFAAIVLATLVAVRVSGGVTRPLASLVEAARRVGRGDYAAEVASARYEEFRILIDTFNAMLGGIAEREQRIVHQAGHDTLTDLPNRSLARDRLERSIATARRNTRSCALLMLGFRRFRAINESLGYQSGDLVLREVARRLVAGVRRSDTVARLGGDEFLVLLEGADAGHALRVAAKLVSSLNEPFAIGDASITLDCATGLALYPAHGDEAEDLLRRVEVAMNTAKDVSGGLAVYQPGQDEHHLRQLVIIRDLCHAIERDELTMSFQPKVSMTGKGGPRVEALVRWVHPEFGPMRPDEFIVLAEQSGNIGLLTRWVLRAVVRQIRAWSDQGLVVDVAMNLSALDLMDSDLPRAVSLLLEEYGVDVARLSMEITESAVMRDPTLSAQVLQRLRDAGIALAIDDFGVGYSSLAQLKRLPVEELKIDKSFVLQMLESADDDIIVRAIIDLGHNMGLSVVAEGVESEEHMQRLHDYGCDMAQGFFISRPLPAEALAEWLRSRDAASAGVTAREPVEP